MGTDDKVLDAICNYYTANATATQAWKKFSIDGHEIDSPLIPPEERFTELFVAAPLLKRDKSKLFDKTNYNRKEDGEIVSVAIDSFEITYKELEGLITAECLRTEVHLDLFRVIDTYFHTQVIGAYGFLIKKRSTNAWIYSPLHWQKLHKDGPNEELFRWDGGLDIFGYTYIGFPIHYAEEGHWAAVIVNTQTKTVQFYNSIATCGVNPNEQIIQFLDAYFKYKRPNEECPIWIPKTMVA